MPNAVREPRQQRSIEKKKRIIEAGFELFARVGYFNTNTSEIAKKAGVSTGIVYGYFHDKRDILLDVLDIYIEKVFSPVFTIFDKISAPLDFDYMLSNAVDATVATHQKYASIHEALHSLTSTDEAVSNKFIQLENEMTEKVVQKFRTVGYDKPDINERVHLAIETIQSYAHECVYDKHQYINYVTMRTIVIRMLTKLFVD